VDLKGRVAADAVLEKWLKDRSNLVKAAKFLSDPKAADEENLQELDDLLGLVKNIKLSSIKKWKSKPHNVEVFIALIQLREKKVLEVKRAKDIESRNNGPPATPVPVPFVPEQLEEDIQEPPPTPAPEMIMNDPLRQSLKQHFTGLKQSIDRFTDDQKTIIGLCTDILDENRLTEQFVYDRTGDITTAVLSIGENTRALNAEMERLKADFGDELRVDNESDESIL
jgi:hypothetical protein